MLHRYKSIGWFWGVFCCKNNIINIKLKYVQEGAIEDLNEKLNTVCDKIIEGFSIDELCHFFDVSLTEYFNWLESSRDISDKIAQANRRSLIVSADRLSHITKKLNGSGGFFEDKKDLDAQIKIYTLDFNIKKWLLEKQLPEIYGNKIEVDDKRALSKISDKELDKRIKELEK